MDPKPRVVEARPGPGAKVQLGLLKLGRSVSRSVSQGRGFGRYVERLGAFFSAENVLVLEVFGTCRLVVPMYDAYWLGPLLSAGVYEPEVGKVLDLVLDADSAFIDCGANIGYWSVMATTRITRSDRIVAIEASEDLSRVLRENNALNHGAFTCLHAAVWDKPDRDLTMASDPVRHSWGSVDASVRSRLTQVGFREHTVTSTTVDSVVERLGEPNLIVIKLDVEGAEPKALAGAQQALERNHLLIYEEHGREASVELSRTLVAEHRLDLFRYTPDLRLSKVDVESVRTGRPERARGYNFFACRPGSPVHDRLSREALTARA